MADYNILEYLDTLDLSGNDRSVRLLSIFSAAITVSSEEITASLIKYLLNHNIEKRAVYEAILQSYLFLGFPRMIEAALVYKKIVNDPSGEIEIKAVNPEESRIWFNRGMELCRRVYGRNFEILKNRFMDVSPEIFRWMVIEGYGKVLSRPGLSNIERELAEVAALIVDRRERQLVSHVIGSLNVGADMKLIKTVNLDIKPLAGEKAYKMAEKVISQIQKKYET